MNIGNNGFKILAITSFILVLLYMCFMVHTMRKTLTDTNKNITDISSNVKAIYTIHENNNELTATTNRMVAEMHEFCFIEE